MNGKEILKRKTILITLPILILLIAALIAVGITIAAGNNSTPETEQTFTEEGDGYYIWVRAVDHAGNKGPWSEAQRVWIDNKGPSAPTITGGSSEYALSRTISVKTEADDAGASGVAYYEYYKKSGADKPDANAEGTKVTTSATSQTFNTNIAGDYVFFRAVDVVGNKGVWSEGQQVCIDINDPTVSAKNSSVTITKGANVEMSTYFTTDKNGNAGISSTTYKIGSTSYTNTSSLAAGTYTVICTVTKVTGKTNSATMTLVVNEPKPAYTKKTYTTAGTYTWTVPAGVTTVKVTVAGGGGGGGGGLTDAYHDPDDQQSVGGSPGGRGGLNIQTINVTPNSSYSVIVGAGGSGGRSGGTVGSSSGSAGSGSAGGTSSFGSITATGGSGGGGAWTGRGSGAAGTPTGAGGAGGAGASGSGKGSAGSKGWVYIEYGGDI